MPRSYDDDDEGVYKKIKCTNETELEFTLKYNLFTVQKLSDKLIISRIKHI